MTPLYWRYLAAVIDIFETILSISCRYYGNFFPSRDVPPQPNSASWPYISLCVFFIMVSVRIWIRRINSSSLFRISVSVLFWIRGLLIAVLSVSAVLCGWWPVSWILNRMGFFHRSSRRIYGDSADTVHCDKCDNVSGIEYGRTIWYSRGIISDPLLYFFPRINLNDIAVDNNDSVVDDDSSWVSRPIRDIDIY